MAKRTAELGGVGSGTGTCTGTGTGTDTGAGTGTEALDETVRPSTTPSRGASAPQFDDPTKLKLR